MQLKMLQPVALLFGLLVMASTAHSFKQGDFRADKNHQFITSDGIGRLRVTLSTFRETRFAPYAIEDIERWNQNTDRGIVDRGILDPYEHFKDPEYHFDGDAFSKSSELIISLRSNIVTQVQNGYTDNARKILGTALHAIQDFYAHSNWVERRLIDASLPHPDWSSEEPFNHMALANLGSQTDTTEACNYDGVLPTAPLTTGYYDVGMSPPISKDAGAYTNNWRLFYGNWPANRCVHGGDGHTHGLNKDYDARSNFLEAKKHATDATSAFVGGILTDLMRAAIDSRSQEQAQRVCRFLGQPADLCTLYSGLELVDGLKIVEPSLHAGLDFTVEVQGSNLTRLLSLQIDGSGYCDMPTEGTTTKFQVRCPAQPAGVYTVKAMDANGVTLSTLTIEVGPEVGKVSTLIAKIGGTVWLWAEQLYSAVATAVWTVTDYATSLAVAVINGIAQAVDVAFSATGEKIAQALFKDSSGMTVGASTVKFNVISISEVRPQTVSAGSNVTFDVIGENLPAGLALGLSACGSTGEISLGTSNSLRRFSCTVKTDARAGEIDGTIGPGTHGDSPFGLVLHTFKVTVTPVSVTSVVAAPQPTARGTSVVTVTGANLPASANVLVDDAACDRATISAKPDGTGFMQTCTFGPTEGTKAVFVMSSSDSSGFVIDDTKTLTVGGTSGPTTALFDDFTGTAIDATKWNIDGWEGTGNDYTGGLGRGIGPVTISNGLVEFGRVGRIGTKGKVTFSGDDSIVIEGRMAGTGSMRDSSAMLVDVTSGDQILMGDTNYAGFGFYALGIGSYKLKEAGIDPSNALSLGGSTTAFMEYRLTIIGDRIKIERGPTLANITQTGTGTLGRSIVGRTFHISIGAAWAYYPATWDWIRVKTGSPAPVLNPTNGHRYEVIECGTWTSCRSAARAKGGELATVRSKAESDWLITNVLWQARTEWGLWIGLTDELQEGVWRWASGEPVTFTNWRSGEPNNLWVDGRPEAYGHVWRGSAAPTYLPGVWNDIIDQPILPGGTESLITQAIVEYLN